MRTNQSIASTSGNSLQETRHSGMKYKSGELCINHTSGAFNQMYQIPLQPFKVQELQAPWKEIVGL